MANYAIGVMNGNWRNHWNDRDLAPTGTTLPIRRQLEIELEVWEGALKQTGFPNIVERATLRVAAIKQKLLILDAIDEIIARNSGSVIS